MGRATRSRRTIPIRHDPLIPFWTHEDRTMSTATATIKGRNLISGRWLPAKGASFESQNPARTTEVVGVFPASSPELAKEAVAAARAAYPDWRRTSRIRRAELFDNLAQIVKRETDNLAQLMARECGK